MSNFSGSHQIDTPSFRYNLLLLITFVFMKNYLFLQQNFVSPMKDFIIFICGFVVGALVVFFVCLFIGTATGNTQSPQIIEQTKNEDINLFEEPGEVLKYDKYKVFQVLDDSHALVRSNLNYSWYDGPIFLITNDEGKFYYDEEVIKVPKGKVMRQVGIYRYMSAMEQNKTVGIIKIMDK